MGNKLINKTLKIKMIFKGAALFAILFVAVLADEPKRELAWYNDLNHLKRNIQGVK